MQPGPVSKSLLPFLTSIGLTDSLASDFTDLIEDGLVPGRVARVDRISLLILTENGQSRAEATRDLLAELSRELWPAVGDWVAVRDRPQHDTDSIEAVLPRSSTLARKRVDSGRRNSAGQVQVIAANVDYVFATHSAVNVNLARLSREVVQIGQSGADPVVILTKMDLVEDPEQVIQEVEAAMPNVPVHLVDGLTGDGADPLRKYLAGNRTIVFIGASGVGKSTLSNHLLGREELVTREIRENDQRGRHTTTARHLIPVPGGGVLIDTPGMRSFALHEADESLSVAFSTIDDLALECAFRNCRHGAEPNCAVQAAIKSGELQAARLESYLKLGREIRH